MGMQERKRLKRIRDYVIDRDGMICCYCDMPLALPDITMEHIVPDSKRGTYNATNLTVSCAPCNNSRGNRPFFEYCKKFNFTQDKLNKYKSLYFNNLRIKVLNIAKENCIKNEFVVPLDIIKRSCKILKIKSMDFSSFENAYCLDVKFNELSNRKNVKYCFEQLIRIIESDS